VPPHLISIDLSDVSSITYTRVQNPLINWSTHTPNFVISKDRMVMRITIIRGYPKFNVSPETQDRAAGQAVILDSPKVLTLV